MAVFRKCEETISNKSSVQLSIAIPSLAKLTYRGLANAMGMAYYEKKMSWKAIRNAVFVIKTAF